MIPNDIIQTLKDKITFAYIPPVSPIKKTVCFIPGFHSDFISSKKSILVYNYAVENNFGFLSWNHTEEGKSIVDWYKDGIELIEKYKGEEYYYIGSSMGLWISLLISTRSHLVPNGILSIGGGIDFTERWLNTEVPFKERDNIDYIWKRPSEYDIKGYYEIPVSFLIESRPALLLPSTISVKCPIYLIHGSLDKDVPIKLAQTVYSYLTNNKVSFYVIKDGDHRLSRSQDLDFILDKMKLMIE